MPFGPDPESSDPPVGVVLLGHVTGQTEESLCERTVWNSLSAAHTTDFLQHRNQVWGNTAAVSKQAADDWSSCLNRSICTSRQSQEARAHKHAYLMSRRVGSVLMGFYFLSAEWSFISAPLRAINNQEEGLRSTWEQFTSRWTSCLTFESCRETNTISHNPQHKPGWVSQRRRVSILPSPSFPRSCCKLTETPTSSSPSCPLLTSSIQLSLLLNFSRPPPSLHLFFTEKTTFLKVLFAVWKGTFYLPLFLHLSIRSSLIPADIEPPRLQISHQRHDELHFSSTRLSLFLLDLNVTFFNILRFIFLFSFPPSIPASLLLHHLSLFTKSFSQV